MRERLPPRRPAETYPVTVEGTQYHVTVGFYADGRPGEVFLRAAQSREGSDVDAMLDDASFLISLAPQDGASGAALAKSASRVAAGNWQNRAKAPASPIGAALDLVGRLQNGAAA